MADLAGGIFPQDLLTSGMTDHRVAGGDAPVASVTFGMTDHRGEGGVYSFQGGGSSVVYWYKIRVRDNGSGPPAVYRTWTSTDPASAVPGAPPVGAWVERTILDRWSV